MDLATILTLHTALIRPIGKPYDWEYTLWAIGTGTLHANPPVHR